MVRATLTKRDEDIKESTGRYWNPVKVGSELEGEIIEIKEDDYGNERVVLVDPDGDERETPAHKDLLEYVPQLREGDYIWITATAFETKKIKDRDTKEEKEVTVWTYQVDVDEPEQEEL